MKTTQFRKIAKKRITGLVPPPVAERIRKEAFRQSVSISAVMTQYLTAGMGMDPAKFGVDAGDRSTSTESIN